MSSGDTAEKRPPQDQDSLSLLLSHHGFAATAAALLAQKPILKSGETREQGRARLMAYADNYYMQFMAMQLERYGFQLNRPLIANAELNYAAGLIEGRHGNPPLDTPHLAGLLTETIDSMMEAQKNTLLTWDEFYTYIYKAHDGSIIRGKDLIKALIKSNLMHKGATIENYSHNYRGRIFASLSMLQVMEQQLQELAPHGLRAVNRFGQSVTPFMIEETRAHAVVAAQLNDPRFSDYVNISAHNRVRACLKDILTILQNEPADLIALHPLRLQLEREVAQLASYPKGWKNYLLQLDDHLQRISTPYL